MSGNCAIVHLPALLGEARGQGGKRGSSEKARTTEEKERESR